MSQFVYHSEQVHSVMENGRQVSKKNIVDIKNNKGTKTVTMKTNGKTRSSTKKLSPSEIHQIQANRFVPGLFKPCYDCLNNKQKTRTKSSSRSKTQKKKGVR